MISRTATGHSLNTVTTPATCMKEGSVVTSCTVCGYVQSSEVLPVQSDAHSWQWTIDDTTHSGVCKWNNEHTEIGNHTTEGGSAATCEAPAKCGVCQLSYGTERGHNYTYNKTADNVLVETCANNCGHSATAALTTVNKTYTGSPITDAAAISYSDNWKGSRPDVISYTNNLDAGEAMVAISTNGATLSNKFSIDRMYIHDATYDLTPESGSYTGAAYEPELSVNWNGDTLEKDTDYRLEWYIKDQKINRWIGVSELVTPGSYLAEIVGIGNFRSNKSAYFTIDHAELTDVEVKQKEALTYALGEALTPEVSESAVAVNGQSVTFAYSTAENGTYGSLPSFTEVGSYTVYYKASAPYHNDAKGSFTVTVDKIVVEEPGIAAKTYTGAARTADVAETELYTVEKNLGGTAAGSYDVVLKLKDAENYKWKTTEDAQVTLQFNITKADNSWTTEPSVSNWIYGDSAKVSAGEAAFGDVQVVYSDGNSEAPTAAGSYTATFSVAATGDYSGFSKTLSFEITKATDTESVKKSDDVTAENVTTENKGDLEEAKSALESALSNYGDNYTDAEKKEITDEIERIDAALEVIENVENVEELIGKISEDFGWKDQEAVEEAFAAYTELSDYEKSIMDEDAKKALDNAMVAYEKLLKSVESDVPKTGDSSMIWLWAAIMGLSCAGVLGVAVYGRKRKAAEER